VSNAKPIRVGMVGSGYVAKAHTLAYDNVHTLYWPHLPPLEKLRIADVSAELAQRGAQRLGWDEGVDDWRRVTRADDIDLVDIVTPNDTHAEIAIDAAQHGKHLFCEKPLAVDAAAARAMAEAVQKAGVINQVCFTYRSWPGVQLARKLIDEGRIGQVKHFRAWFLQDYALDASLPLVWRMQRDRAGAGKLADGGSHLLDIARYLVGDVDRVLARLKTFITERPAAIDKGEAVFRGRDAQSTGELVPVGIEDAADVLLEFEGGAIGVIQTSWVASGHKLDLGFEIGGDRGAIRLSWQRSNELEYYSADDGDETQGFRTIVLGPRHPGAAPFWSVAGQQLGMNDAFLIAVGDLLGAVAEERPATPDFVDGLRACEIVDAALESGDSERWVDVVRMPVLAPA
jgi:levoglucosan dehydrogenase